MRLQNFLRFWVSKSFFVATRMLAEGDVYKRQQLYLPAQLLDLCRKDGNLRPDLLLPGGVAQHRPGALFPVQAFPLFRYAGKPRFHIGLIGIELFQGVNAVAGEKAGFVGKLLRPDQILSLIHISIGMAVPSIKCST